MHLSAISNMVDKVAVVTGSNKGIGFGIVKELCKRGVEYVYLTARDVIKGQEAVNNLNKEGFKPLFHQLDVTDKDSVKALADYLKQKHGGLDILINNAGVIQSNFIKTTYEDALEMINGNYYSILTVQEYLFPILKDNARVINMSSDYGHISNIRNAYWINRLTKEDIKLEDINAFVNWFLDSVKNGTIKDEDFGEMPLVAYKVSKVAVSALTRLQQREVGRGISVNSLHPGFVKTDMTKTAGYLTIEEASKTPVYLALDIDQSVKGKYFWFDKTEKDWADASKILYDKFEEFDEALKEVGKAPY